MAYLLPLLAAYQWASPYPLALSPAHLKVVANPAALLSECL
jgi:hypothetical protein